MNTNKINSIIPIELGLLTSLVTFKLSDNGIVGTLSSTMGALDQFGSIVNCLKCLDWYNPRKHWQLAKSTRKCQLVFQLPDRIIATHNWAMVQAS